MKLLFWLGFILKPTGEIWLGYVLLKLLIDIYTSYGLIQAVVIQDKSVTVKVATVVTHYVYGV